MGVEADQRRRDWLRRRAENVAVALLWRSCSPTFIIQIFFRYVLNNPLGWSEEVIITTWLWTVLWGAAFVLRRIRRNPVRHLLFATFPSERGAFFTILTGVALSLVYGVSLPAAYSYVSFMKVEHSAYLHVPINWMYSIFIIFSRRLHLPLLLAGLSGRARRHAAGNRSRQARRLIMHVTPFAICIIMIVTLGAFGLPIGHAMIVVVDPLSASGRASISAPPPSKSSTACSTATCCWRSRCSFSPPI